MLQEDIRSREIDHDVPLWISRLLEELDLAHELAKLAFHFVVEEVAVLGLSPVPTPKLFVSDLDLFLVFSRLAELLLEAFWVVDWGAQDC